MLVPSPQLLVHQKDDDLWSQIKSKEHRTSYLQEDMPNKINSGPILSVAYSFFSGKNRKMPKSYYQTAVCLSDSSNLLDPEIQLFAGFLAASSNDIETAKSCYKRAAMLGNTDAMNTLGRLYLDFPDENNDEQSNKLAIKWFSRAYRYGSIQAIQNLGDACFRSNSPITSLFYYGIHYMKTSSHITLKRIGDLVQSKYGKLSISSNYYFSSIWNGPTLLFNKNLFKDNNISFSTLSRSHNPFYPPEILSIIEYREKEDNKQDSKRCQEIKIKQLQNKITEMRIISPSTKEAEYTIPQFACNSTNINSLDSFSNISNTQTLLQGPNSGPILQESPCLCITKDHDHIPNSQIQGEKSISFFGANFPPYPVSSKSQLLEMCFQAVSPDNHVRNLSVCRVLLSRLFGLCAPQKLLESQVFISRRHSKDPDVLYRCGYLSLLTGDYFDALKLFKMSSKLGEPRAACVVGEILLHGIGPIERDIDTAVLFLSRGNHGSVMSPISKSYDYCKEPLCTAHLLAVTGDDQYRNQVEAELGVKGDDEIFLWAGNEFELGVRVFKCPKAAAMFYAMALKAGIENGKDINQISQKLNNYTDILDL